MRNLLGGGLGDWIGQFWFPDVDRAGPIHANTVEGEQLPNGRSRDRIGQR